MKKLKLNFFSFTAILFVTICPFSTCVYAQDHLNTITFDNKSGQPALVKLVGPTSKAINVPKVQSQTVNVAAGDYFILVRYGTDPDKYTYTRGDNFVIPQSATQYSSITITLHKIIGGNYSSRPISAESFNENLVQSGNQTNFKQRKMISGTDTLSIHSYPPGLKVYITPLNSLLGPYDKTKWISEKYFVGETPVEIPLKEEGYRVAIQNAEPVNVYNDGESTKDRRWTGSTFIDEIKYYHFFKHRSRKNILVTFFWPKTMSTRDFLKALPKRDFVVIDDGHRSSFKKVFKKHKVPQKEWKSLISMFRKTGKLVWHGKNKSEYLYVAVSELGDDGQPTRITIQPVLDFK